MSAKWEGNLREYDRLFLPYRESPVRMLEIGIQNGGSLDIFSQYFSNGEKFIGCDIDPNCGRLIYDDPRINLVIGDANTDDIQAEILSVTDMFDLIIDDASHKAGDIVCAFARYFPYLKEGGLYVVEDLHCSYWQEFEGGLYHPFSSMAFFKYLADIINHEHWLVNKGRREILATFSNHFNVEFSEEVLSGIHSIEFVNSMCVIRKSCSSLVGLGEQVFAGENDLVTAKGLFLPPSQPANSWSNLDLSPAESFEEQSRSLAAREVQVADLELRVANLNQVVDAYQNSTSWKMTMPLRIVGQKIKKIKRMLVLSGSLLFNLKELKKIALKLRRKGAGNIEHHVKLLQSEEYAVQVSRDRGLSPQFLRALYILGVAFLQIKHWWFANSFCRKHSSRLFAFFCGVVGVSRKVELCHFRIHLDEPGRLFKIVRNAVVISGWGVNLEIGAAADIRVRIGKVVYQPHRKQREDVQSTFATVCELPLDVGFAVTPSLSVGLHRMWVDIEGPDGSWIPVRRALLLRLPRVRYWLKKKNVSYKAWNHIEQKRLKAELPDIMRHINTMLHKPAFTIILDTRQSIDGWKQTLQSLTKQIYPYYELRTLVSDGANLPPALIKDGRPFQDISLMDGLGEFIIFIESGQSLSSNALYEFANAVNQYPGLDLIYGDEDCLSASDERCNPFYKPDWSPDYLETFNYIGFPACFRASAALGCFDSDNFSLYDLVLRFTERTTKIWHVAKILGHGVQRKVDDQALDKTAVQNITALRGRINRTGRQGKVREHELHRGCYVIELDLKREPFVSIIIPTAGKTVTIEGREIDLITNVVDQIRNKSTYKNIEIIVIDNDDLTEGQQQILADQDCHRLTHTEPVFNIPKKLNLGASIAKGELMLLMNDDIEILTPSWIERMVEHFEKPHVGVVGAKLLYPDGLTQHAGVVHNYGNPDHVRRLFPGDEAGYYFSTCGVRNFMAVTGAVMMTLSKVYREVGGYSEELAVSFNDVDYCLKVREKGFQSIYAPKAELTHMESQSRVASVDVGELAWYHKRWAHDVAVDPYYNEQFLAVERPTAVPCVNQRLL
ncbi:MAG: glycosyltransferase [Gammaproteobacteria bacterium]|nr:glycosyltransferase [Gammaproteobacteria bacterium]